MTTETSGRLGGLTGAQYTESARRLARFKFAMDRVRQMADGSPRFTDDELTELADVLLAARTTEKAA